MRGEVALLVGEPGLFGESGHRAHRVEEVREHQREHEHDEGHEADLADVESEVDRTQEAQIGNAHRRSGQRRDRQAPAAGVIRRRAEVPDRLDDHRDDRPAHEADQHPALDLAGHQHAGGQQRQHEHQRRHRRDRAADAESDGRGVRARRRDEARVDEPDERDEQADRDRDRELQLHRDSVEDELSQPRGGQQHDDDAVDHHEGHRLGPRHLVDDAEGEERVDAEPGRERERQPGDEAEEDRHDAGGQRRGGPHGGEGELVAGDVGLARQDDRIQDDDVRHRHEGDQSAADLTADRGASSGDLEEAVECADGLGGGGAGGGRGCSGHGSSIQNRSGCRRPGIPRVHPTHMVGVGRVERA